MAKVLKKAQNGATTAKKPLTPAPKKKTGMDAVKDLGKYVSTFGLAKEKFNPAPKKKLGGKIAAKRKSK